MNSTKNSLLVIILIFYISISASAQEGLKEGYRMIGGSVGFAVNQAEASESYNAVNRFENESTSNSFSFNPYYGRFYEDSKMIGLSFGVSVSQNDQESDTYNRDSGDLVYSSTNETRNVQLSAGMFWRYYISMSNQLGMVFEPSLAVNWSRRDSDFEYGDINRINNYYIDRSETKGLGGTGSLKVGFYYFPFEQLSLEVFLGDFFFNLYDRNTENFTMDDEESYSSDNKSFTLAFQAVNSFTLDQLIRLNYYF